jgi:transcriptional regulator GlxA family with amidase domain
MLFRAAAGRDYDGGMTTRTQRPSRTLHAAPKRVVILAIPPVDALDAIGPAEVFAFANHLHKGAQPPYALELVTPGPGLQVASETGIALMAHRTLAQETRSGKGIDTLVIAAGFTPVESHPSVTAWIRKRASTARRVCSICVGAFPLAEAGVLDGKRATTHWRLARQLSERYPAVQVDPEPIWIKDGNVYTSAGISSGIDLALALVAEDLGDALALEIARNLVLFLRRPGGQAQFSATLRTDEALGPELAALCHWITEHLDADLTVEMMADRQATSVRSLIRLFRHELKTTPAKYVEEVRLEAVGRALERGGRTLEEIARRCGYRSVDVLRKAFTRRFGVSPRDYARRFA